MPWQPPPRPRWVTRLNDHAGGVGGGEQLVSLDPDELIASAIHSTGLSDFGDELVGTDWRTNYSVLTDALAHEGSLHLVGRTMTRTDILRALTNRLELVDLWQREPAILETAVHEPVFVIGAARSGTSILHELLALDSDHASPTTWKVLHPTAAAAGDPAAVAAARRQADSVVSFWHDVQPEYEAMHHNAGDLPTECIFITVPTFLSDNWAGTHTAPSYDLHVATADHTHAYEWHRRTLQTLQRREAGRRWVLKAPSHLATLRQLFRVYPDARIIHIHRDPARTLPSMLNLMNTLKWMRSDDIDMSPMIETITAGVARLQSRAIADRSSGALPAERFHDVHYADLLTDPVTAIESAYSRFGWRFRPALATAIEEYLARKPKGAKGTHAYEPATFGLTVAGIRDHFREYLDHFSIPEEA